MLNDTNAQCIDDRGGRLCGGCREGYSLLMGSNRCGKCNNSYIMIGWIALFALPLTLKTEHLCLVCGVA